MSALSSLIRAVETADSAPLLIKAVQNLAGARLEGAIPMLITVLGYNNPGAAVAAVEGLVQLGEPAVPWLLEQLDLHNYTARAWAIRALAGIGDPRGLVTLLGAATADFALSVRRAAAKGLGTMKWEWFPEDLREIAQEEALEALLFVAQEDDEWVVRYSAVVGLDCLTMFLTERYTDWRLQIQAQFERMAAEDDSQAVRARACLAQQQLQSNIVAPPFLAQPPEINWQMIMEKLYERRTEEHRIIAEGDPSRYRKLATTIGKQEN